ncbi:kinase-like domain-containing protein [Glomus cerebriforme]|uniref:Kinase-like domain-containing protein n=1 Tax=Glomus cerebriforme TaxID=658196 RepID=A0A397TJ30_9GLOM|nr:kinase-like domain-containing protein [Glomus cerebriforme]
MLVMNLMHMNLRNYLQQNHNKLIWKEKIQIINDIISSLYRIHQENAIHRDLHSGNILFHQISQMFKISNLGFCGPVDKPLNSIYGNLPYIAPEVIAGKETTFASDVYSIGILMWEISSGQPPFASVDSFDQVDHDYYFAMRIIYGMRPKIVSGAPLEYEKLMKQCWDADPEKRPHTDVLFDEIRKICLYYENISTKLHDDESMIKKFIKKFKFFRSSESANNIIQINEVSSLEINYKDIYK